MNRRKMGVFIALPIILALMVVPSAHAQGVIHGHWVITQAAQQSRGQAPTVAACGDFDLVVVGSAGIGTRGVYAGFVTFSTTYSNPNGKPAVLPGGTVQGAWMIQTLGALFFNFKGSDVVPAFASIVSPAHQPHPSIDPTSVGCAPLSDGFLGLLHLSGQGTEGATLYSENPVDPLIFTS